MKKSKKSGNYKRYESFDKVLEEISMLKIVLSNQFKKDLNLF